MTEEELKDKIQMLGSARDRLIKQLEGVTHEPTERRYRRELLDIEHRLGKAIGVLMKPEIKEAEQAWIADIIARKRKP